MKILKLLITAFFTDALSITVSAHHNHTNMGSNSNMETNN